MRRHFHRILAASFVAFSLGSFFVGSMAFSQDAAPSDVRQQRLEEMRRRATALAVEYGDAKSSRKSEPDKEPLFRFNDATRAFHDGTLWAWTNRGRPFFLFSIERYEKGWAYELISLSSAPFCVTDESGWTWKPADTPFTEQTIADADAPGETSAARQRQARSLSRRFAAAEFLGAEPQRTELRLQPRPIHEYEDPDEGLLSGSMFIFSNGTNPEVLLMIEAVRGAGGTTRWQYALARISTTTLAATLDGKEVWRVNWSRKPRDQGPYSYFGVPLSDSPPKTKLTRFATRNHLHFRQTVYILKHRLFIPLVRGGVAAYAHGFLTCLVHHKTLPTRNFPS